MSERKPRSAPRVDRLPANQPGARTGSRPKPPEAVARSASLEAARSPVYFRTVALCGTGWREF